MLLSTLLAVTAMPIQDVNRHGVIGVAPGVTVTRAGQQVAADKQITLAPGDTVHYSGGADKVGLIAPDNSVIWMLPGSTLRVDSWGDRQEYALKGGGFRVWSCPHGPPPGTRPISIKSCCIRMWWTEQGGDLNFKVAVMGKDNCTITRSSGVLYRQKHDGDRMIGSPEQLGP